jgi:hypothetical protein
MEMNLNSFSSNLMLIALVLVGLCCLYLLYSNFTKVREIEELKRRVEDLKKIFLNQQMHNDETFSKINNVLFQSLTNGQIPNPNLANISNSGLTDKQEQGLATPLDVNNEIAKEVSAEINQNFALASTSPTKTINIDADNSNNLDSKSGDNIVINKEGYVNENNSMTDETDTNAIKKLNMQESKEINIDLHDLDNLDDLNDADPNLDNDMNIDELDLDENCEEINTDKMVSSKKEQNLFDGDNDVQVTKDNLFNLDTVNITNAEIFDDLEDTLSIATAPIDETNDVINHTNNFNLDDIQDIPDIDDLDNLESIDIKTVQLNVATSEDNDISQLLNGNINQSKNIESHQNEKQSMKTIEIDAPKIDYNIMSVKQLKDIAKSYGLKSTGTKQELIQILLAHDSK